MQLQQTQQVSEAKRTDKVNFATRRLRAMKAVLDAGFRAEKLARHQIENRGFQVQDANVLFRQNCPNIDLVVFARTRAIYVQVKASNKPAGRDCVLVAGSPWTQQQLYEGAPIYNKHDKQHHFQASLVLIVHQLANEVEYYLATPDEIEHRVRASAMAFAAKPKRDGSARNIGFRKELRRSEMDEWRGAWALLGDPPMIEEH